MDRQQYDPRRRTDHEAEGRKKHAPERKRELPRHSGDKPASARQSDRKNASRPSGRKGNNSRSSKENQRKREQQLRREKQQRRIEKAEKRKQEAQRRPVRPFARRTFLIRLFVTVAVVVAVVIAMTIFFKVDTIAISGNYKYSAQEIAEASGIDLGENLLLLRKSAIAGQIHSSLPYVGDIQVGIKFPDTVNIDIVEQAAVFAIEDVEGSWWLLSDGGLILDEADVLELDEYIRIQGARVVDPVKNSGMQIAQQEDISGITNGEGEALADRKSVILQIMAEIAAYDRSGDITLIDVSDLWGIEIWYGKAFQVLCGDATDLPYKTRYMICAVDDLEAEGYRGGVLDLAFREDGKATFTPW